MHQINIAEILFIHFRIVPFLLNRPTLFPAIAKAKNQTQETTIHAIVKIHFS